VTININDKEVIFQIFEKEPLLVDKEKPLPVVQDGKEVTEIKATVADGYAVAEVELRQKGDSDFKKWLKTLKIDGKPKDRKKSYFWLQVENRSDISVKV